MLYSPGGKTVNPALIITESLIALTTRAFQLFGGRFTWLLLNILNDGSQCW